MFTLNASRTYEKLTIKFNTIEELKTYIVNQNLKCYSFSGTTDINFYINRNKIFLAKQKMPVISIIYTNDTTKNDVCIFANDNDTNAHYCSPKMGQVIKEITDKLQSSSFSNGYGDF